MLLNAMIEIPRNALPRGYYAEEVANNGHVPGVLSGANLSGKARSYGAWYHAMRCRVAEALRPYGVYSGLAKVNSRLCRVWVDKEGNPVEVTVR